MGHDVQVSDSSTTPVVLFNSLVSKNSTGQFGSSLVFLLGERCSVLTPTPFSVALPYKQYQRLNFVVMLG